MSENKTPYANEEKIFLINLIEKFKSVIENKKSDNSSLQQKQKVWDKITDMYNTNFSNRNVKQLKKLWDNLKQKSRKTDSELKYKIIHTGGGPPPEEADGSLINEMVRAVVHTINFEVAKSFDSDGTDKKIEKLKKKNNDNNNDSFEKHLSNYGNDNNITKTPLTPRKDKTDNDSKSSVKKTEVLPETRLVKKQEPLVLGKTRKQDINELHEEISSLRVKKLRISIEQQEELHNLKMDVARAEKNYWEKKLNQL